MRFMRIMAACKVCLMQKLIHIHGDPGRLALRSALGASHGRASDRSRVGHPGADLLQARRYT